MLILQIIVPDRRCQAQITTCLTWIVQISGVGRAYIYIYAMHILQIIVPDRACASTDHDLPDLNRSDPWVGTHV